MTIRDALLREFDLELPFTRLSLARVPMDKLEWKPHEKSMTLGWLATFLAICPSWGVMTIEKEEFDPRAAAGGQRPEIAKSTDALLALFDQHYTQFRAALAATTDDRLLGTFTLKAGGEIWFSQPRWLVIREYILNHVVHHRAQLGVFLRLNGIAVPAIYNDSADEKGGVFRTHESGT